ncbi:MAG: DUF563 domain-containing protein [Chroococcidiopsidaceae cyanobacterium CP_BM_RX_35]|nr:DUF563 domain-containing protein [Chroococcidiopsidaceae cyanobacterium CP_BM_RX_35]
MQQKQAFEYLEQGEYDNAIVLYQQYIEANPDLPSNYWHFGLALLLAGEELAAQTVWLSALAQEIDLDFSELLRVLEAAATRHFQSGNMQLAERIYWQILELNPEQAEAHYNLGSTIAHRGDYDAAVACWQRAVELQPDFADAYQNQGYVLQKQNKFAEAIPCYLKVLEIQPGWVETHYNLGICFHEQGRLDEAIACFQQAVQLQPGNAQAYGDWGNALLEQGKPDEAIACFQQAIQRNPVFVQAYCQLSDALLQQGKSHDVITSNADFLKVLQLQPDSVDVYLYLGKALAKEKKFELAIACYRKALQIQPDLDKIYFNLGKTQVQQGDLTEVPVAPPSEFYESAWDWVVTHNLDTSNYISIYPKNQIQLKTPKTIDKTVDFAFRFGAYVELPATFVAVIPEGRFWLNQHQDQTAIITADNKLLADVSPDFPVLSPGHPDKHPSRHAIFSLEKLPPVQHVDGTVAVLSGLLNNVYFHWMFDVLPRIELLRCSRIDLASIDQFIVNNSSFPFHKETLDTLGIPESKRLESHNHTHIKATKLVVPSFPGTIAWIPKWACDFLRTEFLNKRVNEKAEKIERIYISRRKATNRRIVNEDEVTNFLSKFGFEAISLESMSVAEQAFLIANAKVVLAPHGSGLTNIVFCEPGTKVIEIFSPNYVYPCYWLVSNIVNLKYYYLVGEKFAGFYLHKLLYPNPGNEDIFISTNLLLEVMKLAEVV